MRLTPSRPTTVVALAALLFAGAASAQQASFVVAVTLHTGSKAMAANQLCPGGRPLDLLAASAIRVDCPVTAESKAPSNLKADGTTRSAQPLTPAEVIVTF